jgi:hypothetical protein
MMMDACLHTARATQRLSPQEHSAGTGLLWVEQTCGMHLHLVHQTQLRVHISCRDLDTITCHK